MSIKQILDYTILDGSKGDKDAFEKDKSIDIDGILGTAKKVCDDTTFEMFFEEPHEDLIAVIKAKSEDKRIDFFVYYREAFYQKHIGKYMDSKSILEKTAKTLKDALDSVCWKKFVYGDCDVHCK